MKKILLICTAALGLGLSSCDSYLDINQDPNSPTEENITSDMLMPAVEMNIAASYGNFLRSVGGYYVQHYSQMFGTSNYLDYSQFTMSATRSSGTYTQLTSRVLKNAEAIRTMSAASEDWGTYLAATVLRAYTYQILVDCYGEVPYTEALNVSNTSPKYDEGKTIYEGVLGELDYALDKVSETDPVCTNFLFPTEDAGEWIKFANALKLRMLMRMSNVVDVKSKLAALIKEGNFPTEDVAWADCWSDESGKANPFYQEEFATYFGSTQTNVILNIALQATMAEYDDARLAAFFKTNSSGNYTGGVSGTNFSTTASYKGDYWCRPIVSYDDPVTLISVSEIEFFLAEYEARYGTSANAEVHYKAAVEASFAAAGVGGADIALAAYPWNNANYQQVIGLQKWIALSGSNNFEAWCEARRLRYPAFGTATGDDIYSETNDTYDASVYEAGTFYTPIHFDTKVGAGKLIQRFPYAESSANRNNNTPVNKGNGTPIFWAE